MSNTDYRALAADNDALDIAALQAGIRVDSRGVISSIAEELAAFDDGGPIGVGVDGNTHNDPYCSTIAPMGSYEASHGEPCDMCQHRKLGA